MSGLVDAIFGGGGPDTSGMNTAALMSATLGNKAFDWFSQEYDRSKPDRDKAANEASQVTKAQLDTMAQQNELAKDYSDYNKETYRPLEQKIVSMAQAYDTPERRQEAADQAVADVNSQVGSQREATRQDLARAGVSPESMKSQALMASGDINASRAAAGAAGAARRTVESTGHAMMADAANLGRGLPSAQATAVQTGTNAGNSAVGASNASLAATQSGTPLMQSAFGTALAGQGQAGQIFGQQAGIQSQTRGQDLNFMSSVYGSFMKSDPAVKKNRKVVKPEASMAALRDTPIESWQYDPKKGGPEDGNAVRTGPMADRAQETMGDEVAPGGEMLNVASMLGVVANGLKDVDKRLSKLEPRKAA